MIGHAKEQAAAQTLFPLLRIGAVEPFLRELLPELADRIDGLAAPPASRPAPLRAAAARVDRDRSRARAPPRSAARGRSCSPRSAPHTALLGFRAAGWRLEDGRLAVRSRRLARSTVLAPAAGREFHDLAQTALQRRARLADVAVAFGKGTVGADPPPRRRRRPSAVGGDRPKMGSSSRCAQARIPVRSRHDHLLPQCRCGAEGPAPQDVGVRQLSVDGRDVPHAARPAARGSVSGRGGRGRCPRARRRRRHRQRRHPRRARRRRRDRQRPHARAARGRPRPRRGRRGRARVGRRPTPSTCRSRTPRSTSSCPPSA